MNKRKGFLARFLNSKGNARKNILLSLVAVIEVIAISVIASYAWIENISAIKISGNGTFESKLYTTANIGTGAGYQSTIDLANYFRTSGGMHLGSASSANGTDVFFPVTSSEEDQIINPYRKSNISDNNVNYYHYSLKVKAATGKCDFFFREVPTISVDGTPIANFSDALTNEEREALLRIRNAVRLSITVDSETNIFTLDNISENVVSSLGGLKSHTSTYSYQNYIAGSTTSHSVFAVDNGSTKTVEIRMWLQDTDRDGTFAGKTISVTNLVLEAGKSSVYFADYTSKYNAQNETTWQWASDTDHPMFVYDGSKYYPMTKTTQNEWTAQILTSVLEDTSKTIYYCRCNTGTESITDQNDANVLQYWAASINEKTVENKFKAYGNVSGKAGFGTWGDVVEISLGSANTTVLPVPAEGSEDTATHVELRSAVSGNSAFSEMNFYFNSSDVGTWRAYLPIAAAASVSFKFTYGGTERTVVAGTRDNRTSYMITSESTGYWAPPATVTVAYVTGFDSTAGTIKVSGGVSGAHTVDVTAGTTVTLTATEETGYRFLGWSENQDGSEPLLTGKTKNVTAPAAEETKTYYAKYVKLYTVNFHVVTDNDNEDTLGGTVKIDTDTEGTNVSKVVDDGSQVTLTAKAAEGFTLSGIYRVDGQTETAVSGNTPTITADTEFVAKFTSTQAPSDYYLNGDFNSWDESARMCYLDNKTSTKKVFVTVELEQGTHDFKIHHKNTSTDVWYTNSTQTITDSTSSAMDLKDTTAGTNNNAKITASSDGYYTFIFDISSSGSEKLTVFYQRKEAKPADQELSNVLVFNTSTQAKALWIWQNAENEVTDISGAAFNTDPHAATDENTISTYAIGGSFIKPKAIGLKNTVSDGSTTFPGDGNGEKMTGDIVCDSDISSYPDRVFYTDTNNTNNTTWKTFSHIQGTVALNKTKPRTCNVITLSATTDSGTLKKSETYTYYVKKGTDSYRVGKADTDTVSWMPMEAGSYQVYVMVKDKWGIEKIASSPVVVQVK